MSIPVKACKQYLRCFRDCKVRYLFLFCKFLLQFFPVRRKSFLLALLRVLEMNKGTWRFAMSPEKLLHIQKLLTPQTFLRVRR